MIVQGNNIVHSIERLGDAVSVTTGNCTAEEAWACGVWATMAL